MVVVLMAFLGPCAAMFASALRRIETGGRIARPDISLRSPFTPERGYRRSSC